LNRLPLVLAIEPDLRQAAIVKRVVKERVQAEIVVVDSRDAAIATIRTAMPDVLLVSALLSPRDEDDLMAHLRTLDGAAHLQTHTIPQLASSLGRGEDGGRGGLFSAFRRKKAESSPAGCDPDLFADEIRMYVQRAVEKKREAAEAGPRSPVPPRVIRVAEAPAAVPPEESLSVPASSWSSPFEWRPSNHTSYLPSQEPKVESPAPAMADPDSPTASHDSSFASHELPAFEEVVEPLVGESGIGDLGSGTGEQGSETEYQGSETGYTGSETAYTGSETEYGGSGVGDLEAGTGDLGSGIGYEAEVSISWPPVLAVWARKRPSITDLESAAPAGEFHELFAGLGVPDEVASVAYANGCRIRRVRVPVAREQHGALHGAVLLSRRMLAELRGTDVGA
jgi:hypothetical protein